MDKRQRLARICEKTLGFNGRMISGSKSIYRSDHPNNVIVFNANIATNEEGKLWHGDLDLTLDHELLCLLAKRIGDFQVFYEMDLRFDNEENFDAKKAVATFTKSGVSPNLEGLSVSKDGALCRLKEVERVVEVSEYENQKDDFKEIRIPNVKSLRVKSGHSAWIAFQDAMIKEFGEKKAAEIYQHLYLTKEDAEVIAQKNTTSLKKKFPGLHKAKIEQSVAMDSLQHGCLEFLGKTPSWAELGFGYVKKTESIGQQN